MLDLMLGSKTAQKIFLHLIGVDVVEVLTHFFKKLGVVHELFHE